MIRRLRLKFVLMNMAFVTALLAAVFSLVLHTTRNELAQAGLRALEQAALEHLGPVRPDRRPGEPGRVPCFVLRTGPRGELIAAGDGYYDLTDEDWLLTLLAAAQEQGGREGVLEDYGLRFCRSGRYWLSRICPASGRPWRLWPGPACWRGARLSWDFWR